MADRIPKVEISSRSQDFSEGEITVDVQIYKIEGNDGWTLEVVVDEGTSISWTELFPTDREAWDDFMSAVGELGLRRLLDADESAEATIH
jgi:hypothetical protein